MTMVLSSAVTASEPFVAFAEETLKQMNKQLELMALKFKNEAAHVPDAEVGRHARKAADIMEERGWTAGAIENMAGQVCAMGAFHRAVGPMAAVKRLKICRAFDVKFTAWLQENYPGTVDAGHIAYNVPDWNDWILREDTLQWLRKFADAMDPKRV